ncbi:uncharacterized protein L3040_002413 [Drepanopeziza brunnea f. sp. 'multigermtubi']|uniref:YTH domain-containing protein n=1 Tax=Marssonina brunnea f. sp. multigermtubi (strain MB_m1) TaxID=1072389 RepID=K1WQI3_MARBU|nr:uncharacterized protein MBM_01857 [Drepanopeziza brunnea f. sp. 'multigermtubi' MB_m1]EKD19905.1 hypothetical protein MBM_01857 [Drepanopeziza brunnea f. sp. 'multigermtubi' MB_m1]KAJ5050536.1 hypothetical protein L3040_002413 [Drepanopeziza brunnea f. sp. 'multigermtubi']
MMQQQYDDSDGKILQPGAERYKNGPFVQHQTIPRGSQLSPPASQLSFSASEIPPTAPTTRATIAMDDNAARIKALLLASLGKGKEDVTKSTTPPVTTPSLAGNHKASGEASNSLRGSLKLSTTTPKKEDIDEFVREAAAESANLGKNFTKPETPNVQKIPVHTDAKSQAPSLGSPTNATKPVANTRTNKSTQVKNNLNGKTIAERHASNESISEGEILEEKEPITKRLVSGTPNQVQVFGKAPKIDIPVPRKPRDERTDKPASLAHPPRDESSRLPPAPKSQFQRHNRDDRHEECAPRPEKQGYDTYKPNNESDRKAYTEPERPAYQRRDNREEEHRRTEPTEQRQEELPNRQIREQKPPTLDDLLPLDEDLRDWLEITGYHNAPYRSKILNRRRAIAALDAKRDQLLAEMEAEERGGIPASAGGQVPASPMLPPPLLNKAVGRLEPVSSTPARDSSDSQLQRVAVHKRPYSDVQDSRGEPAAGKFARTEGRAYVEEEGLDRRPRSSGFDRRERDDNRTYYGPRSRSRDRGDSPGRDGRRAYENRSSPRGRGFGSDNMYDREDVPERSARSYQVRGNYRGNAYDPNFRGQGRARGRGRGDYRDFNSGPRNKSEGGYGMTIATGKPFKDPVGFDRGGKGETRYFIVKSFNEENVLRCIQDSVWTTQVQNGHIFKRAFETCKNVILVFSTNKSKAFQGYARMEGLPGSAAITQWQRVITWESAGAFKVRWLVVCPTFFHRVGHLKNSLNEGMAVFIGKDGQEIEENCGSKLVDLIDEEFDAATGSWSRDYGRFSDAY